MGETSRAIYKRKQYLVKRALQFRYASIMIFFAIISGLITGYTVFLTGWTMFGSKLAELYPQGRFHAIVMSINFSLFRNILFILPVIFILAIYLSHKIAGPVYRIEQSCRDIGAGKLGFRIQFRKGDELREMEQSFNEMIQGLEGIKEKEKEKMGSFMGQVEGLCRDLDDFEDIPVVIKQKIAEIQKRKKELQDQYTVQTELK